MRFVYFVYIFIDDQESKQILSLVRRVNSDNNNNNTMDGSKERTYDANLMSGDSNARFASLSNGGGSSQERAVGNLFARVTGSASSSSSSSSDTIRSKSAGKYSKSEGASIANGSTVVSIFIPLPSFRPVPLSLSRSP